jgi:hypothetical protein
MSLQPYKGFRFFVKDILRACGVEISRYYPRGKEPLPLSVSNDFKVLYKKYCPYSMIKWSGLYTAFNVADHISKQKIKGDIVECGVWEGGCSAIIAEQLVNLKDTDRDFYLYDTYEGMTEPTEKDYSFAANMNAQDLYKTFQKDGKPDWCLGTIERVQEVMKQTGYPQDRIYTIKGKVEETIPDTIPKKIALLRLDTDWYESTKHELEHLFPRLVKGGVLIVDDYAAWAGSKEAVDEYFAKNPCNIYFHFDHITGNICGIKQ